MKRRANSGKFGSVAAYSGVTPQAQAVVWLEEHHRILRVTAPVDNASAGESGQRTALSTSNNFRDQIEASKVIQRGLLAHWGSHPEDFPRRSRDLADDIRPALDAINRQMLLLVPRLKETTSERCALFHAALDQKLTATPALRELDEVRWEAADVALRSLRCAL